MDLQEMTKKAWERVDRYLNLQIGGKKIVCPYFTNHAGFYFIQAMREAGLDLETGMKVMKVYNSNRLPYGWFRGKGTPEQIEEAAVEIAGMEEINLDKATAAGIVEFLRVYGLGVDCSGFVYNVLTGAGIKFELEVFKAGAFTFAGKASEQITDNELQSTDLILIKKISGEYSHVALVLEKEGELWICQSTSTASPAGVVVSKYAEGFRSEMGTDWEELRRSGRLELRRLCNYSSTPD
jgi:hypothetical protein